jgi:hypothetical protein
MAYKGFALYKKDKELFLFGVAYEYAESRFVGFDDAEVYKINKLNQVQKDWLKTHDPRQGQKTKNLIFIDNYYLARVDFKDIPKGKPYTQLVGGGGVYKETRKYQNLADLFKNETFLKALERYGTFSENYASVKKIIKEMVDNALKQEVLQAAFTAVSIEKESEKNKLNKIFDLLNEEGLIPENFKRPTFKNGDLDYHMTIKMGEIPIRFKTDLNKEVVLNIETIGISKDAVALGVSGDYFSDNQFQHITLAFRDLPQESKLISDWRPLKSPFKIEGVIREFTSTKEIIKRGVFNNKVEEANQIQIGNFVDQALPAGNSTIFPK